MDNTVELVKALLNFLALFGVVLLLAWLTTRFVGGRMSGNAAGSSIRVVGHIPAGRERSIMMVEVGGRVYLLGVTAQQITLLDAIEDREALDKILAAAPAPGPVSMGQILPRSFTDALARALGRQPRYTAPPPSAEKESGTERLREQIERLRRMQQ